MTHPLSIAALARLACLSTLTILTMTPLARAQAAKPKPPPTPQNPAVVLPLERTNYFMGEMVLLAITNDTKPYQLQWRDAADRVAVSYQGSEPTLRVPTDQLAPGKYQLWINGQPSPTSIGLASPLRVSPAAFPVESRPSPQTPDDHARLQKTLQESEINAVMAESEGEAGAGRYGAHEDLAATATLVFFNPSTRPLRDHPARVYEPELRSFRQRLALCTQANSRYPTFGGFLYDRGPTGFGDRRSLLDSWAWGKDEPALRHYLQRSYQAVLDDFTMRTHLKPVTDVEYWQYCLSMRRPEFAPVSDLPTYRWARALAPTFKPLSEAEREQLEKRLDAWSSYLMGLYAENYAGHNAVLRGLVPSLRHTASVNVDHEAVRKGQYTPSAYAPLDFRYITAGVDYPYQWLFSAALVEVGRKPDQPVWVATPLGTGQDQAAYPGQSLRMAGHHLAYGGLGLGLSLESQGEQRQGQARSEDLVRGREFLQRFAALGAACTQVRHVGLLYSRTQLGRQHLVQTLDTPQFNAFTTLARLGYTPHFITEEEILAGDLEGLRALVVVNQCFALPAPLMAKLQAFVATGGHILTDRQTTISLPKAVVMDVSMPYKSPGLPHNWSVPNLGGLPCVLVQEQRHRQLAPAMLAALGNDVRTGLRSSLGADSRVSTFQLNGGPDASYVVAVNDAVLGTPANWVRLREELVPNKEVPWTLYDLTKEQALGRLAPVTCVFDDLTARVYGILRQPVKAIDVQAIQRLTGGEELQVRVRFTGADDKVMRAAIPFHLTLKRPNGTTAQEFYRSTDRTGNFVLAWTVPVNEPAGIWTVEVRSQLDGMTASLPVMVEAGDPLEAEPVTDRVMVRGRAAIQELLAKKPAFVLPLFTNDYQARLRPVARAVQQVLANKGVPVEVRPDPTLSIYVMGYDSTKVELLQNLLAEKGETIGKIKVTTTNHHDYFAPLSGYVFGKPIILLDLAGTGANEMAARLETAGLLWPRVSPAFPGPGRAVMQLVKGAFWLGQDALVIQASDVDGLREGVAALAALPADWMTPGIEGTRKRLLSELGIGEGPQPVPDEEELTREGLETGTAPRPLALRFGGTKPPSAAEVKAYEPPPVPVQRVPADIEPNQATPFYFLDGKLHPTVTPRIGDARFVDALMVKIDARDGGRCTVTVRGTFRYSDRPPRSQALWEEWLALYNAKVPKERQPMQFVVWIDGKPAGCLTPQTTETREVPIETLPLHSAAKPRSVKEEVVTHLKGTISLAAGQHEILLFHRNVVDGQLERVKFDWER
jgi:hypothetical protein